MYACSIEVLQKLCAHPKTDVNFQARFGETFFMLKAGSGEQFVNTLFACESFDPNIQEFKGQTALHKLISMNGYNVVDDVRFLCSKAGVRLDIRDNNGNSPLDIAKALRNYELVELLEDHISDE